MSFYSLYLQGRFIRASELCNDLILLEKIKKRIVDVTNPVEKIQFILSNLDSLNGKIKWQFLAEEAIDTFEGINRTNLININDAYRIFIYIRNNSESYFPYVNLPTEITQYINMLITNIHESIEMMSIILSTKYVKKYNIDLLNLLMNKFLTLNPEPDIKENTILQFLKYMDYSTVYYETYNLILNNFDPFDIKTECDMKKLEIIIKTASKLSQNDFDNNYVKCYGYTIQTIHNILVKNSNLPGVDVELAIWTGYNKSNFYSNKDAAKILFQELNDKTIYPLANLMLNDNKIDVIADNIIIDMLMKKDTTKAINLLEKFYDQKRCESIQILTIANNTQYDAVFNVRILHNKSEIFTLPKAGRKIYKNLRDYNITHVGLTIKLNDEIIFDHKYVDIHTWVSFYMGRDELTKEYIPTVGLYYQFDPYLDELEPIDEMIKNVSTIIKIGYIAEKLEYPEMNYNTYVHMLIDNMSNRGEKVKLYSWSMKQFEKLTRMKRLIKAAKLLIGEEEE
jgi:hypothetical protein